MDTGYHSAIQPGIEFHELLHKHEFKFKQSHPLSYISNLLRFENCEQLRFMELPAQAIQCMINGVCRPDNPDGSQVLQYPQATIKFMLQFLHMNTVAFFLNWRVCKEFFLLLASAIL